MPKLILASGCDRAYYPRMRKYTESVQRHNNAAKTFIVGVGWQPPDERGFKGLYLPAEQAKGHGGTWCVQHGGFLSALPAEDADVVIFTDGGDVVMQRGFSAAELGCMAALDDKTVMVGWNAGPQDNLLEEAPRLGLQQGRLIPEQFRVELPVYNTGVVVATAAAYRRLYDVYMQHWDLVDPLFHHYAKQQWLMSWVLGTDHGLRVELLPYSFHTHGCYGMPPKAKLRRSVLYAGDKVVLFRHRI